MVERPLQAPRHGLVPRAVGSVKAGLNVRNRTIGLPVGRSCSTVRQFGPKLGDRTAVHNIERHATPIEKRKSNEWAPGGLQYQHVPILPLPEDSGLVLTQSHCATIAQSREGSA